MTRGPSYQLVTPGAGRAGSPRLDPHQQRVLEHPGGPLLVLAGPGTGKTTTLVEAIVERIEGRGVDPSQVLALTFSRKAAEQLRDRVTARLGRTLSTTVSSTFHSFAYGLVRAYAPADLYAAPLRLLSAPEQDVILQQLLTKEAESVPWPSQLAAAVGTRGFAREVSSVLARARERGLSGEALVDLGRSSGRPEYVASGLFLEQYLDVLDAESAIDYPDLISRAVLEADRHRDELRARFRHVFVDEYQDTDPAQVALLRALAGDGRDLVVVGDPDQSIYGFRGADVRGILDFPRAFPTSAGADAPVVALRTTRRFGSRLLAASQSVAASIAVSGSVAREDWEAFRSPVADPVAGGHGSVEVLTFDTARAETEHLADLLRRAHLEDGVGWSEMAVLVRSGRTSIPALRRSLAAAGVPVEVAADETPLVREPAAMPLLSALQIVVDAEVEDPTDPRYVAVGPGRGAAHLAPRRARRDRRPGSVAGAPGPRDLTRGEGRRGARLVARAAPEVPDRSGGPGRCGWRLRRARSPAGRTPRRGAPPLGAGASAEEVLWVLWSGTDWGPRLRASTRAGGHAARFAHRDLDALCALFETAARAEEQRGHTSVQRFLDTLVAQDIPADTLADRGVRGESVRLLTAHRSKGLEWRLVVVAHVQDGAWPDLRRRGSLLDADRISRDGLLPPATTASLLAEERRVFYVACTRARERLVVTAVASPDDEGEQPSRFLSELGPDHAPVHRVGRPRRPLSMSGLVAELRRTTADPQEPAVLRRAAADRLATLMAAEVDGRPVAPAADPASWWGMRALSRSERPVRPVEQPLALSASALQGILDCPARWFLRAGGRRRAGQHGQSGFRDRRARHRRPDRQGRAGPGRRPDGPGRRGLGADGLPHPVVAITRARRRRRGAGPFRRLAHRLPGSRAGRHGGLVRGRRDPAGRPGGAPARGGRPARARRRRQRGRGRPEDRQVRPHRARGRRARPAGALPARGRQRRRRRGRRAARCAPGEPSWSTCVWAATCPRCRPRTRQPSVDAATPAERQLMRAARALRDEEFVARPEATLCSRCDFVPICPAHAAGSVLS